VQNGYLVELFTADKERADKLKEQLLAEGFSEENGVFITDKKVKDGFIAHDCKCVVLGSDNIYLKPKVRQVTSRKKTKAFFSAPVAGDYAVHEIHGIGKVIGNKKLTTGLGTKDYVAIAYKGGDILYVPVEQLDAISRYVGGEKEPQLSKIGGKDFERIKSRVRESLKQLSFDLKKLYSERASKKGFVFECDEESEILFESAFGHEDTYDQTATSDDIRADMCSSKVMDRLVCGDVGYGKTEVALRAVFRAILNGKQAVMLAPTTILAEQHFNTAKERFKDFAVTVESLDRFKTKKQQTEVLQKLKEGKIDFIVGTHRLLSSDVEFKDLGLLVLDEEQRFGVEHKEKIKLLKNNVDTLTLTATPIPRTLHMSLSGIRDISTIKTAPKERLPVQTYVTEETDSLIVDACRREIVRGGQVFILYNRVETIYHFAEKIKNLLPNAKITVAHGQLEERVLEKNIAEFYRGESDILLATTIIENGIDLPKANTIIVIDADKLGLSTLYQLRGRVGRSNRLAHAYFTFKREKVLSDVAYKRLSTLMEFTEMGSGFKIAMRDLEIRGAGDILGAKQHGHLDKVGYELYSKLLQEELEGKEEQELLDLDVKIGAYIPDEYIENASGRMDAYKEIASIEDEDEAKEILRSLKETYGPVPVETLRLIKIALIKRRLTLLGAKSFYLGKESAFFGFKNVKALQNDALLEEITKTKGCSVAVSEGVGIKFERGGLDADKTLNGLVNFLGSVLKKAKDLS
jgi:transcription-repair coupling factor (superfamily II helicase)